MGPITKALVRLFVERGKGELAPEEKRSAYGFLEGYVSVVINTVLFVVKLIFGLLTGSIALIADAVHTLADSATSVVIIVASSVSRRPADAEHPYGHGRSEGIATVIVAIFLAVAGFEFGKASVARVLEPQAISASWLAIGVVVATAAIKEWLSRFALSLARASGNEALEADAWHHRSDVAATALVAVAMVAGRYGIVAVDGWMGLAVSVLLFKVAVDISRRAIDGLLGKAPTKEEVVEVRDKAMTMDGVRSVHDIVIHKYGETRFISLHIETADQVPAGALHALAERVEARLAPGRHGSVCVHVDPVNVDHPAYARVQKVVEALIEEDESAVAFHDLRIVGDAERFTVILDIGLSSESTEDDAEASRRLRDEIRERSGAADVVVEVEPRYSYQP